MAEGKIPPPPIAATLGFDRVAEVEEGRVVFHLTPAEHHYNPIGSVHGGVYATWKTTRGLAIALLVAAILAAGGAIAWYVS